MPVPSRSDSTTPENRSMAGKRPRESLITGHRSRSKTPDVTPPSKPSRLKLPPAASRFSYLSPPSPNRGRRHLGDRESTSLAFRTLSAMRSSSSNHVQKRSLTPSPNRNENEHLVESESKSRHKSKRFSNSKSVRVRSSTPSPNRHGYDHLLESGSKSRLKTSVGKGKSIKSGNEEVHASVQHHSASKFPDDEATNMSMRDRAAMFPNKQHVEEEEEDDEVEVVEAEDESDDDNDVDLRNLNILQVAEKFKSSEKRSSSEFAGDIKALKQDAGRSIQKLECEVSF